MKNKRKGIILAGGSGTRLYPVSIPFSKQLIPVFNKPMIYYPLATLMLADIKEILIITTKRDALLFKDLLKDGSQWGLKIKYAIQKEPKGIVESLIIAENFLSGSPCALILGDNIFHGNNLRGILKTQSEKLNENCIFTYYVKDPERYGVANYKNSRIVSLKEKPKKPKSNFAITGLYFYDQNASENAKKITPSNRGELEITDLNKLYLKEGSLNSIKLKRGYAWLDTGTFDSLIEASFFVSTIEKRQGLLIASPEEVAYRLGYIDSMQLKKLADSYNNSYGNNLLNLLESNE
tara:strand:- start:2554 stop:3432 length:879 start_codon:yes stop_codon:yes gene_type:complete